ncbi:MAG TPA: hypothetical protein DCG38_04220 [Eubacteriaceae bacterium]|jgi:putative ABC transport system permease protein|nr:hypothetical protein [Eubacteriaceae bacterium]
MKKRSFYKNLIRSISNSKGRFFSIMAIVFLGVSFFAGINATEPDMIISADKYYKEQNLSDFKIISPLGFKDEDLTEIKNIRGVSRIQNGYYKDLFLTTAEGDIDVAKLLSYDPQDFKDDVGINTPFLIEGRLPQNIGEISLESGFNAPKDIKIGDKLTASVPSGEDIHDGLNSTEYTVVGFISSPLYITYERGQTNIGDGSVDYFGYIYHEDFNMKHYNEIYISLVASEDHQAYSDGYEKIVKNPEALLEALGIAAMMRETKTFREELEESRDLFLESKAKAQAEIDKGQAELENAEKKIEQGANALSEMESRYKREIEMGQADLDYGKSAVEQAKISYFEGYAAWLEGYNEYQDGRMDLIEAKSELDDAKIQIENGETDLENARAQLETTQATIIALKEIQSGLPPEDEIPTQEEYDLLIEEIQLINPQLAQALKAYSPEYFDRFRQALDSSIITLEENYAQGQKQVEEGQRLLDESKLQYENGLKEYEAGVLLLQKAKAELDEAKLQIDFAKDEIEKGEIELQRGAQELEKAQAELDEALNKGYAELEKSREDVNEGWKIFEEEKRDALAKITEAEIEIKDAQRQLLELPKEWFVNTRDANPGYSSYGDDANRIGAVAKVFPLFFFLVAALVCLTTMTRMVEEERVQIGTLKALGYNTSSIALKYLAYGLLASLAGSVAGFLLGFQLFPRLIMTVYGGMYDIPYMLSPVHLDYAMLSTAIAVLTTVSASLWASLAALRTTPAQLMQPKAPKPGKRILIERIGLLWNHMNFTQKVTARNIFRYKRRFFMTVIGISGCSALLLAGYGIKDSVNAISQVQFDQVFLYDGIVAMDTGNKERAELQEVLGTNPGISEYASAMMESVSVFKDGGRQFEVSLWVPEAKNEFANFFDLHERVSKDPISLGDDGAVITEKLSRLFGVESGDSLEFRDSENRVYSFEIAGIAENYLGHNVFMSKEYFDKVTLREPEYNAGVFKLYEDRAFDESGFKEDILAFEGAVGVSLASTFREDFNETMSSLDYVVLILILSAGALAFVVLYNLTNINITERIREIATIKVLGFRSREISAYVYRENLILSFIGTVFGLFLGSILHRFVMDTMEVDNMMFGRIISGWSFLYAVILTMIFSVLVNVLMFFKLKKVDMVESLKSIE